MEPAETGRVFLLVRPDTGLLRFYFACRPTVVAFLLPISDIRASEYLSTRGIGFGPCSSFQGLTPVIHNLQWPERKNRRLFLFSWPADRRENVFLLRNRRSILRRFRWFDTGVNTLTQQKWRIGVPRPQA